MKNNLIFLCNNCFEGIQKEFGEQEDVNYGRVGSMVCKKCQVEVDCDKEQYHHLRDGKPFRIISLAVAVGNIISRKKFL